MSRRAGSAGVIKSPWGIWGKDHARRSCGKEHRTACVGVVKPVEEVHRRLERGFRGVWEAVHRAPSASVRVSLSRASGDSPERRGRRKGSEDLFTALWIPFGSERHCICSDAGRGGL
jgi:hypothetical protein